MTAETLFQEALARTPAERAAFLEDACAGRPELRAAVEALLAAREKSGPALEQPPAEPARTMDSELVASGTGAASEVMREPGASREAAPQLAATSACGRDASAGAVIAGRYTLQERIGEGGMGEVWVARQTEPVKRKVALKLIKAGMDSRAVLQRFEQERQALAMMDHPNIARVLDAGMTPTGQPFFVMELVNGLPLTRFCDEAQLTPKERLELFVPICQAVQHAHHKGIVHRDLKPANILVTMIDGRPVPKVIDFGVAKATAGKLTEETMSTGFGAVVGTLEYMSPEQAAFSNVDIDTRADIYSLGVILYELLTGLRPIDGRRLKHEALTEMIRIIREEEPSKPSTRLSTDAALPSLAALRHIEPRKLMALLRGDLDWVVMKCLEKQRERRYETASGLARDIQRYLDGEAVEACPPSVGYRLGKFLKRNQGPVLAASLLLLAMLGGIAGTTWGMIRADRARADESVQRQIAETEKKNAETSAKIAQAQRVRAESREEQAIDAVKRFGDAVANEPGLKNSPQLEGLRKRLLNEPLAFFRDLRDRLQADDDTRLESLVRLGQAGLDLSVLTNEIGDKQDSLIAAGESLAIWQKLADAHPTVAAFHKELARSHNNRGNLLSDTGKPVEAMRAYESALAIQQKLVDDHPTDPEFQRQLAASYDNIGMLLSDTGKPAEAMKAYESALAIQQKLVDDHPAVAEFQSKLAGSYGFIGMLLGENGNPAEALKAFEPALAIWLKLADAHPGIAEFQSNLAGTQNNIGEALRDTGQSAEAMKAFKSALAIQQRVADAHPTVILYQQYLANHHSNIGNVLATGKPDEALAAYESALAIRQKLADANPTVTDFQAAVAASHRDIGTTLHSAGKPAEALQAFASALAIQQKLAGAHPTVSRYQMAVANLHNEIGLLLEVTGKPAESLKAYEAALAISQKLAREYPESPDFASDLGGALHNVAAIDVEASRFEEARVRLREAVQWQRKALAVNAAHPQYRQFMINHLTGLAVVARELGDAEGLAEAERELATLRDSDAVIAALDARLSDIIMGREQPTDEADRLRLGQRAYDKALHAAAARLWGDALASNPKLGDDRRFPHRYNAACAAALAGCGKGKDDPAPDDVTKTGFRRKALDWLNTELDTWTALVATASDEQRGLIDQTLRHWKQDADLADLREDAGISELPEEERVAFKQLWNRVDELLTTLARGQ